jgi:hypothetical protein
MTARELEEYRTLRSTILQRGTARMCIVVAGLGVWAALTVAGATLTQTPAATLVPLLFLAATFEVVFALHTGVERVGRYLQVFYERDGEASWERTAMAFGRTFKSGGIDALFSPVFWVATLLNLLPAFLNGPMAIDSVIVAAVHLLFSLRIWTARTQSGRQRALDLQRFEQLRDAKA